MGKIRNFFEFFYALPTNYMRNLPYDKGMILPSTFVGAALGAGYQAITLNVGYHYILQKELSKGSLTAIGLLSVVPVITNTISGIREWRERKKRPDQDPKITELEKALGISKYTVSQD